jgi:hypothetical protein
VVVYAVGVAELGFDAQPVMPYSDGREPAGLQCVRNEGPKVANGLTRPSGSLYFASTGNCHVDTSPLQNALTGQIGRSWIGSST